MGSVNKVTLIGNLGRDAEMKYTNSGTAVATLSLATTEKWSDKGGNAKEKTEWHRVVIWGKMAESLEKYLTKGKQIYVEGSLETRKWTNKDGADQYTTEVKAHKIVLLGGGGDSPQSSGRNRGRQDNRNARPQRNDRGDWRDNQSRHHDDDTDDRGYGDDDFLDRDNSDNWTPPV